MKIKNLITLTLLFIFTINQTTYAKKPAEFIKEITTQASNILSSKDTKDNKISKLKEIAEKNVDIKALGFYTLGQHRKNITDDQKKVYNDLFKQYFLKSFSNRLVDYTDPKIEVNSQERLSDKYTIVKSTLVATEKRPEVKLDWRVYTKNPTKPLIRDLIIEGLSLARTQKEEFNSIIQSNNNDIEALFNNLRKFTE